MLINFVNFNRILNLDVDERFCVSLFDLKQRIFCFQCQTITMNSIYNKRHIDFDFNIQMYFFLIA